MPVKLILTIFIFLIAIDSKAQSSLRAKARANVVADVTSVQEEMETLSQAEKSKLFGQSEDKLLDLGEYDVVINPYSLVNISYQIKEKKNAAQKKQYDKILHSNDKGLAKFFVNAQKKELRKADVENEESRYITISY